MTTKRPAPTTHELGHGRIKPSGDLNAGGLFHYESASHDPAAGADRTWRPDLVPAILRWCSEVPPCDWRLFCGFEVTKRGGFGARFLVHDRNVVPREVLIQFDHDEYICANEVTALCARQILPYNPRHLFETANLRLSGN